MCGVLGLMENKILESGIEVEPATFVLKNGPDSPCTLDKDGCALSPNFGRENYGNSQKCTLEVSGDMTIHSTDFATEASYDVLKVAGKKYSGNSGVPATKILAKHGDKPGDVITWKSDSSVTRH